MRNITSLNLNPNPEENKPLPATPGIRTKVCKMYLKRNFLLPILLIASLNFYGCGLFSPTIAGYNEYAYAQTTSLKVDALSVMDSATTDYQSQVKGITAIKSSIQKLVEYEQHLPKNDITIKQWHILNDTAGHLFGGFMVRWRNEKKLHRAFIDDEKKLVADAFDQIAELESKKIKTPNK